MPGPLCPANNKLRKVTSACVLISPIQGERERLLFTLHGEEDENVQKQQMKNQSLGELSLGECLASTMETWGRSPAGHGVAHEVP